MDLDDAISALEALTVQLEAADSNVDDSRLGKAISESVSVADAVLSPEDGSLWRKLTNSVLPNEQAAVPSSVKSRRSVGEPIVVEPLVGRCSNSRCGTLCGDDDLKRRCAFDCGVRFCNSHCWRERRACHEAICTVLQKKAILRKLRIGDVESDELF